MKNEDNKNQNNLNPNKWVNTLPGKNLIDNSQKLNLNTTLEKKSVSSKKYSLTATLFIVGLILVSVTKNETRNLQKEISILQTSINNLQLELHQAIIEHEVITSPENIAKLATEHLDSDFNTYKKSQINQLTTNEKTLAKLSKIEKKLISKTFCHSRPLPWSATISSAPEPLILYAPGFSAAKASKPTMEIRSPIAIGHLKFLIGIHLPTQRIGNCPGRLKSKIKQ